MFANNRIGILGVNGAGKSTLIKVIAGENKPSAGQIQPHADLQIAYFAQDFISQLDTLSSPLDQCKKQFPQLSDQEIRNHLGQFGFSNDTALQTIHSMSGGEKARLALSILVLQKPNLLILDEPTNHLDLDVRESLTLALQSYEGALLLVSHDRHLLESVCDEFYLMDSGILRPFEGDLDDYRRYSQEKNRANLSTQPTKPKFQENKKSARKEAADLRAKLAPYTRQVKNIENQLEKLNDQKHSLDELLADTTLYNDENKEKLQRTLTRQAELKLKIEELEENWMSITEQVETLKQESG